MKIILCPNPFRDKGLKAAGVKRPVMLTGDTEGQAVSFASHFLWNRLTLIPYPRASRSRR